MRLSDTLAFVRGGWRIERVLVDHRSGTNGTFTGSALLDGASHEEPRSTHEELPSTHEEPRSTGAELRYFEHGELRFGGHTGSATRSLAYQGLPDGTVQVRFADGRPFYLLDLRSGQWRAEHLCGEDRYEVTHLVLAADLMEERWRVLGPDKDYQSVSTLARLPADAPGRARPR